MLMKRTALVPPQPIEGAIWDDKYRLKHPDGTSAEQTLEDTFCRVAHALGVDPSPMLAGLLMPAGRFLAGAGSGRHVTLFNCFVSPEIEDSMDTERDNNSKGIMDALKVAAFTQQMGGGIGMDFSTLRPRGALVGKRMAAASGPLHFMDMWDGMCACIESSGARRGAMMATMRCDHPDVEAFVEAKRQKGRLTNFNVSVLITDDFLQAVKDDGPWSLGFGVPPYRRDDASAAELRESGQPWYVYKTMPARELWEKITRNTYDWAEPGVIFIDRVNTGNNLAYCENMHCTNPCGEQPLPANGNCNLSATVLPGFVSHPFTPDASFDFVMLAKIARAAMRMLDQAIDVSLYATPEQELEGKRKRRTGLGVLGLGNALQMLGLRYGSDDAQAMTSEIMRTQAIAAYDESSEMAREKGSFPAYDREKFLRSPFVGQLPEYLQTKIEEDGIRNGVLLTVAPTGTTAIVAGCMTGGVEPTFDWHYTRRVRQPDGVTYNEYEVEDYGHRLYRIIHGDGPDLPDYMITTQELSVADHVRMQAACQTWVDASISKTINLPKETSFEDFQEVYLEAHRSGLKSCTTYRPSDVRGAVLISVKARPVVGISTRPRELPGCTYKIKWPNMDAAIYVTICDIEDAEGQARPYEIFFNSRSIRHYEWMIGMSRMISSVFRQTAEKGTAPNFVAEELMQVHSMTDGQWHEGRYVPSIVAAIGTIINEHTKKLGLDAGLPLAGVLVGETCRSCGSGDVLRAEGCITCRACGHSNCG